jgi:hypothetical protein
MQIPYIVTHTHDSWCQKWLDWKLHSFFISPYCGGGSNDGTMLFASCFVLLRV